MKGDGNERLGLVGSNRNTRIEGGCDSRIGNASKQNITLFEDYTYIEIMHWIFRKINSDWKGFQLWKMKLSGNPDFKGIREAQSFTTGGDFASASA